VSGTVYQFTILGRKADWWQYYIQGTEFTARVGHYTSEINNHIKWMNHIKQGISKLSAAGYTVTPVVLLR
jgi:hypothetical protein